MRSIRASLAAASILLLVAACSDVPSAPSSRQSSGIREQGALVAGTCTTLGELESMAHGIFDGRPMGVKTMLNKLRYLDEDVRRGKLAMAAVRAHDIVDYTLIHYKAGRLPGSGALVTEFVNSVYCFAGLDLRIEDPANAHLIMPSDQAQLISSGDAQAGVLLGANVVPEPTLIEFRQLPDTFSTPGGGPLDTKLDQYPGYLQITQSSAGNSGLLQPVVVGVCADGVIPQEVRDRLRLGHGKSTGFEIAPPADAGFLDCENATSADPGNVGVLGRIARLLLPKALHASAAFRRVGGGVGGTVTEFSPFAPVDPELRSGGGVGGTVTEFIRSPLSGGLLLSEDAAPLATCPVITAPEVSQVPAHCRPIVRIRTRLGTSLSAVPITWSTADGSGKVAAADGSECGAFAAVIVNPTDLFGQSAVCWKLGAIGLNQVTATPSAGGDAPEGVTFVPASLTFDAQATPLPVGPPSGLFMYQGNGQTAPAGQPAPINPGVIVGDKNGRPVPGVTVYWTVYFNNGSVSPEITVTDALGRASVSWTLGAGQNRMRATYVPADPNDGKEVFFLATGTPMP